MNESFNVLGYLRKHERKSLIECSAKVKECVHVLKDRMRWPTVGESSSHLYHSRLLSLQSCFKPQYANEATVLQHVSKEYPTDWCIESRT